MYYLQICSNTFGIFIIKVMGTTGKHEIVSVLFLNTNIKVQWSHIQNTNKNTDPDKHVFN